MSALPAAFLRVPVAHRALHDRDAGRPENSRAAIRAAMDAGYGIEIDLQPSRDGRAMVFHDYDLRRLTGADGPIRQRDAEDLMQVTLLGSDETIPTLAEVLDLVAGQVPLLIELKDQHGQMGPTDGALERAVVADLRGYDGPVALMSFNPNMVAALADLAPHVPRGIVTCGYGPEDWPLLKQETRAQLRDIPDFDRTGASFVSHHLADLGRPRLGALKAQGVPVLSWTIRTADEEARSRRVADNITFEGYLPTIPG